MTQLSVLYCHQNNSSHFEHKELLDASLNEIFRTSQSNKDSSSKQQTVHAIALNSLSRHKKMYSSYTPAVTTIGGTTLPSF